MISTPGGMRFRRDADMPHVVLVGELDLAKIFASLEPFTERAGSTIMKTSGAYLERGGNAIVVEAAAIENGKGTNFLVPVSKRDDGLVVRLHPSLNVEKTDGVKRLLALLAKRIVSLSPGLAVGKTNLQEFLEEA